MPRQRWLWRHVLRAASNPLISLAGLSTAGLLSGGMIVEIILGWPGLGPLLYEAVLARDTHLVVAVGLLSATLLVTVDLVTDLGLVTADRRLRSS